MGLLTSFCSPDHIAKNRHDKIVSREPGDGARYQGTGEQEADEERDDERDNDKDNTDIRAGNQDGEGRGRAQAGDMMPNYKDRNGDS